MSWTALRQGHPRRPGGEELRRRSLRWRRSNGNPSLEKGTAAELPQATQALRSHNIAQLPQGCGFRLLHQYRRLRHPRPKRVFRCCLRNSLSSHGPRSLPSCPLLRSVVLLEHGYRPPAAPPRSIRALQREEEGALASRPIIASAPPRLPRLLLRPLFPTSLRRRHLRVRPPLRPCKPPLRRLRQ